MGDVAWGVWFCYPVVCSQVLEAQLEASFLPVSVTRALHVPVIVRDGVRGSNRCVVTRVWAQPGELSLRGGTSGRPLEVLGNFCPPPLSKRRAVLFLRRPRRQGRLKRCGRKPATSKGLPRCQAAGALGSSPS